jgi:hypothetical protein
VFFVPRDRRPRAGLAAQDLIDVFFDIVPETLRHERNRFVDRYDDAVTGLFFNA